LVTATATAMIPPLPRINGKQRITTPQAGGIPYESENTAVGIT
jgi:hypothetical protein